MATTVLGKVSITPKGTYNSANTYTKLDTVYDATSNASYLSLKNNNSAALSNDGVNWMYLCRGIGVSTDNNFTDAYKTKLDGLNQTDNNYTNADKSLAESAIQPTLKNAANGYVGVGTDGNIDNTEFVGIKTDLLGRGLNVKNFGASGSTQTTTGTISAGSTALTLASAIDFANGQGISINHAGVACVLTTPTAPTVTPTGTDGTTTYQYQIVALDANGGCTAAGAAGITTTGNATLNATNYNTVSWAAVSNATMYAIYGRTNGEMALLGITSSTTFNDTGLAATTADCVPSAVPSTSLADIFVTSIASGAGTTNLVLADAATTAITSQSVSHDDTVKINETIQTYGTGQQIYLPKGTYSVTSPILANIDGMKIVCDGTIKISTAISAIKINCLDFDISINKIQSNANIGTGVMVGGNDMLVSIGNSELSIDYVYGAEIGIHYLSNNGNGIQLVKTQFRNIECLNGLVFQCGDSGANWVNQNTTSGGWLQCNVGIKFIKGAQQVYPFDGNLFEHTSFENTILPIDWEYCERCKVDSFRMYEQGAGPNVQIKLHNCKNNEFVGLSTDIEVDNIHDDNATLDFNYFSGLFVHSGTVIATKVTYYANDLIIVSPKGDQRPVTYTQGTTTSKYDYPPMLILDGTTYNVPIALDLKYSFSNLFLSEFYVKVGTISGTTSVTDYAGALIATSANTSGASGTQLQANHTYRFKNLGNHNWATVSIV